MGCLWKQRRHLASQREQLASCTFELHKLATLLLGLRPRFGHPGDLLRIRLLSVHLDSVPVSQGDRARLDPLDDFPRGQDEHVVHVVPRLRRSLQKHESIRFGERFSIRTDTKIRPSDRLYKMEKVQQEKTFE